MQREAATVSVITVSTSNHSPKVNCCFNVRNATKPQGLAPEGHTDSFPRRLDFSGRGMQRTVCTTACASDVDRADDGKDVKKGKVKDIFMLHF